MQETKNCFYCHNEEFYFLNEYFLCKKNCKTYYHDKCWIKLRNKMLKNNSFLYCEKCNRKIKSIYKFSWLLWIKNTIYWLIEMIPILLVNIFICYIYWYAFLFYNESSKLFSITNFGFTELFIHFIISIYNNQSSINIYIIIVHIFKYIIYFLDKGKLFVFKNIVTTIIIPIFTYICAVLCINDYGNLYERSKYRKPLKSNLVCYGEINTIDMDIEYNKVIH